MDREVEVIFQMILYGGNARSDAMEAIQSAKQGKLILARKKLKDAAVELQKAHKLQTEMIQNESAGNPIELSLLLVHAQDHLMNAITIKELATEIVDIYERGTFLR